MKNPYLKNITLLIVVIAVTSSILAFTCKCTESCCCNIHLSPTAKNIIIGLISSALLLLLSEFFQFRMDKNTFGKLEGIYSRTIITDVIANSDIVTNEKREEDLSLVQRQEFAKRNLLPIPGSRYVEIVGYRDIGKDWRIKLKYLHHGTYEGIAEYHKYWGTYGDKTEVKFTLTLNKSNLTTGAGNYKYVDKEDYGIYSFQINENDNTEILVTYQNTIPSGLAEGYEKWKKIIA